MKGLFGLFKSWVNVGYNCLMMLLELEKVPLGSCISAPRLQSCGREDDRMEMFGKRNILSALPLTVNTICAINYILVIVTWRVRPGVKTSIFLFLFIISEILRAWPPNFNRSPSRSSLFEIAWQLPARLQLFITLLDKPSLGLIS